MGSNVLCCELRLETVVLWVLLCGPPLILFTTYVAIATDPYSTFLSTVRFLVEVLVERVN